MVLYKRKRVTYVRPPPVPADLSTEIYVIPQTKEWFLNYEAYLARVDYYNRRKFVCEITGNSCLTYYEAYDSETKEIEDLEANFPEALREHILKFLQFNRISRLELLVDKVYSVFKNEYFPGEEVYVKKLVEPTERQLKVDAPSQPYFSTAKYRGMIREKVQYSNPSDTKYLVATKDGTQIIATNLQISRDRNHFTKWLVKTYVKLTVTRSPKVGAPWVVKEKYAKKYRIAQEFPEDLKQFEALTPTGEVLYEGDEKAESPSPADGPDVPKVKKPRGRAAWKIKAALNAANAGNGASDGPSAAEPAVGSKSRDKNEQKVRFPAHHLPAQIKEALSKSDSSTPSVVQPSKKTIIEDLNLSFDLQNARPAPAAMVLPQNARDLNRQIMEQLEEETAALRAEVTEENSKRISENETEIQILKNDALHSVQEALECWTFLNIYHSILKLDTFTFDDFLCAMGWNDEQLQNMGRCELSDEIWCAVLGLVVSKEPVSAKNADGVKVPGLQITLPSDVRLESVPDQKTEEIDDNLKGSDSENEPRPLKIDDEVSENESTSPSPQKVKKGKRGRKPKERKSPVDGDDEDEGSDMDITQDQAPEADHGHNAYSVMNYRGTKWYERLRKRNFKDGQWLTIVIGVLSLVEYVPEYAETIQKAYKTLAPAQIKPASPSSVLTQFYTSMGIDLRLKVLHILTSLVVNGPAVRNYMDESLEQSTNLRRTRLDILRDWKSHVETANKLHTEIFTRLMEEVAKATDSKLWSLFSRKRHRLNTKGYEMSEYENAVAESDPSFKTLWDAREDAIAKIKETRAAKKDVEMQLSQLDCQRVRLLGKDRHFNRYWWFENNGLPNIHFSGDGEEDEEQEPESDDEVDDKDDFQTETYLMGCLWIQGPTGMDALSHLKISKDDADQIIKRIEDDTVSLKVKLENGDMPNGIATGNTANGHTESNGLLKEMDFTSIPGSTIAEAERLGLRFSQNSIQLYETTIIDKHGGLPKDYDVTYLSAVQRKFIEEQSMPLFSGTQWRCFDRVEDVESLAKWLNPWGKRESSLRKEFLRVKEGMTASIVARRKALWLDKLPKEEAELEGTIEAVETRIKNCKNGTVEELDPEESGDDLTSRKRPNRRGANGANKRQKTADETLKTGSLQELEQLQEELKDTVTRKIAENQVTRVMEWVNRTARDELDKSLYEGGDKAKQRGRKSKK